MKNVEEFLIGLENQDLSSSDNNFDGFLDLADYARELAGQGNVENIKELIKRLSGSQYYEALSWVVDIIQEEYDKGEDSGLKKDIACPLGRQIPGYNEFMETFGVDANPISVVTINKEDSSGEPQSFDNIQIMKTGKESMFLATVENFDVVDNDHIDYVLVFSKDIQKTIERLEQTTKTSTKTKTINTVVPKTVDDEEPLL